MDRYHCYSLLDSLRGQKFKQVLKTAKQGFTSAILVGLIFSLVIPIIGPDLSQWNFGVALAASDPVIAAAGDIACDPAATNFNGGNGSSANCRQKYTSDLLVNTGLSAVLDLGDNQYYCGSYQAYLQSYDLSWGRVKSITHPSVGNHEYLTAGGTSPSTGCTSANAGAAGYFQYFGAAAGTQGKGYYSFDVGSWHLISLNSNCSDVGGCNSGSPQYTWLQNDLATHSNYCTLAFWHIPLYSSGGRAASNSKPFWQLLYNYNADLILNGHDHIYERFAPQDSNGVLNITRGIREFISGTGGSDHTFIATVAANSELRNESTFGVLKLTLHPTSYDWQFVPEAGKTFTDSGSQACHGSSAATFKPAADTYVNSGSPTTNYGGTTTLRADGSPDVHSYLRFTVSGLGGRPIIRARLLLYANSGLSQGVNALAVANNTWGELTTTYNNAPSLGSVLATSGAITTGTWATLDVTSYITGEGTFSIGINTASATAISLASRESGANSPLLILDFR